MEIRMENFTTQFDKFCNKLGEKYKNDYLLICDDNKYNNMKTLDQKLDSPQKYIQAASEQIYYYWLKKRCPKIQYDVKINPPKDVDLYCDELDFNLRIEVKTPEIDKLDEKYDSNVITLKMDHRYDNLPKENSPSYKNFQDKMKEISEQLNIHSAETGKVVKIGKNEDLKIKTFLDSANEKMNPSDDKTINSLLICLDTSKLGEYLNYIINEFCGCFSEDTYLNVKEYKNIDFLILSNCCEAHLDSKFNFNVWDAKNYFNFIIPLHIKETGIAKCNFIANLFNDEFMKFLEGKDSKYNPKGLEGIFLLQYGEFISIEHPCFCPNINNRKY